MNLSSRLLDETVNQFARLPGIGNRTALRLVLHLLKQRSDVIRQFAEALNRLSSEIKFCSECHNISDTDICLICSNIKRDATILCVVQDVRDVIAIENTHQFNGIYHVLGGVISPIDGVGPSQLTIESLRNKAESGKIKEVILALSTTLEGETTSFYIYKKLSGLPVTLTSIARGIGIGDQLEYADEVTLGRSLQHRIPLEASLSHTKV